MARINDFNLTLLDVVTNLSDGNPGAINVMMLIERESLNIDPQASMGGLMKILFLDTLEIYGPEIWLLFKDQCGQDIRKVMVLLRAVQLGFLNRARLKKALVEGSQDLLTEEEITALDKQVCDRLDGFKKPEEKQSA